MCISVEVVAECSVSTHFFYAIHHFKAQLCESDFSRSMTKPVLPGLYHAKVTNFSIKIKSQKE